MVVGEGGGLGAVVDGGQRVQWVGGGGGGEGVGAGVQLTYLAIIAPTPKATCKIALRLTPVLGR